MYILSGENSTAVFTISRRRWDQNTTQVANRLNRSRATYVRLLHLPPWYKQYVHTLCRNVYPQCGIKHSPFPPSHCCFRSNMHLVYINCFFPILCVSSDGQIWMISQRLLNCTLCSQMLHVVLCVCLWLRNWGTQQLSTYRENWEDIQTGYLDLAGLRVTFIYE